MLYLIPLSPLRLIWTISLKCIFSLTHCPAQSLHQCQRCQTVINAFVSSCLNYCNALFISLPASSITRLLYIQNSAVRILTHNKRSAHITPILFELHWLPVAYHGLAPHYLCNLLLPYIPTRSLHSSEFGLLFVPRYCLSSMWSRSFSVVGNSLPQSLCCINNISEFKSQLKTHLFFECYHSYVVFCILLCLNLYYCLLPCPCNAPFTVFVLSLL